MKHNKQQNPIKNNYNIICITRVLYRQHCCGSVSYGWDLIKQREYTNLV